MSDIEQVQMDRYYDELEDDMRHLVKKYCRIMGWSIPDLNVQESRKLILEAIDKALTNIKNE